MSKTVLKIPCELIAYAIEQRQLVHKYETNRFARSICFYILLKQVTPYSCIKNFTKQLDHLKNVTGTSTGTFYNRLQFLQNEGLLTVNDGTIKLCSWKTVAANYQLNFKQFIKLEYDKIQPENLYLYLFAADIKINKEKQRYMIQKRLCKNPTLKSEIINRLVHCGADERKLSDFDYLLNSMRIIYKASFIKEPETHDFFSQIRPDCNRSVKTIANHWNFKSAQSVSYYKAKLKNNGIAEIIPGQRIVSKTRARNFDCNVKWIPGIKQTMLCLVDVIQPKNFL